MGTQIDVLAGIALDLAIPETYTTVSYAQLNRFKSIFAQLIIDECIKAAEDAQADYYVINNIKIRLGAFNGYVRSPYSRESSTSSPGPNPNAYFKNQSAFQFFPGFGEDELIALFKTAENSNIDTVWVPAGAGNRGRIGLNTWYVRALIQHHFPHRT